MRRARAQRQEARDIIKRGGGGPKQRKKPQKSLRSDVENRGDSVRRRKKRRQERFDSEDVDPEDLDYKKEKVPGAQELNKNCRESVSPYSRLTRFFVICITNPPWENECEWHRMTRMAGPDCPFMCNLNKQTHTHAHTQSPLSRLIREFRNKYP